MSMTYVAIIQKSCSCEFKLIIADFMGFLMTTLQGTQLNFIA